MRKIKFNRHTLLSLAVTCAAFTSCTTSDDISPNVEPTVGHSELTCEVKDKEYDDLESRSALHLVGGKMQFSWNEGDGLTVFARGDNNAIQIFRLEEGAGEPRARFSGENFRLKKSGLYFAFSKVKGEDTNVRFVNQNDIRVDYSGQTQIGNASDNHLGDYDFMAAGEIPQEENAAHFLFSHLGATLRVVISFNETGIANGVSTGYTSQDEVDALQLDTDGPELKKTRFTELELFDKQNNYRQTERFFSFATGTNEVSKDNYTYTFQQPVQNIEKMDHFKLKLRSADNPDEGITRLDPFLDHSGANNKKIIAYMEVPPYVFPADNKINIVLRGYYEKKTDGNWVKHPVSYTAEYANPLTIKAGAAHQISFTADKTEKFKVTLNVNHNWQHGDVVDNTTASPAKSRATTGDPGNDKTIYTPNYIYFIYCHDGKVAKPTEVSGDSEYLTEITAGTDWSTRFTHGEYISSYTGTVEKIADKGVISLVKYKKNAVGHIDHAGDCTHHLYVVASKTTLTFPEITESTTEEEVRAFLYNIPDADAQVFMRDLYSTPWDDDDFEGNLVDAVQDITLYHVAAMVDVKWNTETTPVESVSVNDVKKENLFLFKPTENIYSAGSYDASNSITDEDQKYLGRTVFYLPQFKAPNCQYNIGFNSEATTPVTFTPDVTNGYTSWLRLLKKKN